MDTIKGLSAGRPGNLVGKYWEKLIFSNLKECVKNEYSFKEEACGSTAASSYLNLCGHQSKTDTRKSIEQITRDKYSAMIVHCPNTNAFDLVIFDKCNKIHAIQVTVQTAAKKCNDSDFFKTENIHFTYLLAPYKVDVNAIKLKSKLYYAYVAYGLRIVNGASFLTQKELSTGTFQFGVEAT